MSKHEIDIMWQKAMCQSIEDGEMFTRYHFAKLVAERALADPMREVQRLGQEIEQEPVAWRNAAIRVGEDLSSVGPDGYYDMTAQQWLDWSMAQEPRGKNSLAQPERHELQAKGEHPAPCARHCEANAFQIVIKNLKAQLAQPEQEPPKYSFKAHWEKDGRIGVVGAVVRPDGGVHLLQDIIDPPQRTEPLIGCVNHDCALCKEKNT